MFPEGIPGLLPLIINLPVRFTESLGAEAREMGVFKHCRGILRGWELEDEEVARLAACDDPEVVLNEDHQDYTLKCPLAKARCPSSMAKEYTV